MALHAALLADYEGNAQYCTCRSDGRRHHQDQATQGACLLAVEETVLTMQQQLTIVETAVQAAL
jgi:hypothetical protein